MKSVFLTGVAGAAMLTIAAPAFASDSLAEPLRAAAPANGPAKALARGIATSQNNLLRRRGGHFAGRGHMVRFPRGHFRHIRGFRRPFHGFFLPRFWHHPRFFIVQPATFHLSHPASGFGWSRYYDYAVLADRDGRVYDYRDDVRWDAHPAPTRAEWPRYDPGVLHGDDEVLARAPHEAASDDAGSYHGTWEGSYVDPEARTYQGSWQGTYRGADGEFYRGRYRGTFTGEAQPLDAPLDAAPVAPPPPPRVTARPEPSYPPPRSDPRFSDDPLPPDDYPEFEDQRSVELYERCLRGEYGGLTGALIGAGVGAGAGAIIAGEGDDLEGALIGGGIGALAGGAIERERNRERCERFARSGGRFVDHRRRHVPPRHAPGHGQAYGWHGQYYYPHGYYYPAYYYAQPAVTTVVVTPGTTTTTFVEEEVVYDKPKKKRQTKRRCKC